jgi:hypothetical protein
MTKMNFTAVVTIVALSILMEAVEVVVVVVVIILLIVSRIIPITLLSVKQSI